MFWKFMRDIGLVFAGIAAIVLLGLLMFSKNDSSHQEKGCVGDQCPSNFIESDAMVG